MPRFVTTTVILGKAMIGVAVHGYKTNVLESLDINSFK